MVKAIRKLIGRLRKKEKDSIGNLYYLYGIKPVRANKRALDECTVTKLK
jgi:hypothetical protein